MAYPKNKKWKVSGHIFHFSHLICQYVENFPRIATVKWLLAPREQKMKFSFNMEDASQIFVGAFALAVPVSFSEEAWNLGQTLPFLNLMMLFTLSALFLGIFTYQSVFQKDIKGRLAVFILRIIVAYLITALVVCLVLLCLDKLPLIADPITSFKRVIVITMPASMGAIVVDSFDKE